MQPAMGRRSPLSLVESETVPEAPEAPEAPAVTSLAAPCMHPCWPARLLYRTVLYHVPTPTVLTPPCTGSTVRGHPCESAQGTAVALPGRCLDASMSLATIWCQLDPFREADVGPWPGARGWTPRHRLCGGHGGAPDPSVSNRAMRRQRSGEGGPSTWSSSIACQETTMPRQCTPLWHHTDKTGAWPRAGPEGRSVPRCEIIAHKHHAAWYCIVNKWASALAAQHTLPAS
ncbi:hypothetical protein T440DRAFT_267716 [Plenodomus tracheiphilus IPT5]|uniref:Uncharacterized protein n=1 Tax=Plenodomus tracheiphilus IPT5 TaxID=1408161 RepID=A0A6A7BF92_9PLEO|nr:hypothetical protein T440DRAFT_267716 [Plenodomus tracheiphilus IPT5]